MKDFKEFKNEYDSIKTPENYDAFIDECIENTRKKPLSFLKLSKIAFPAMMAFYLLCLNTLPTFAKTMFEIPIIGEFSKILCIRGYDEVSDNKEIHIKVPQLKNIKNTKLEKRVNEAIQKYIDVAVEETQKEAKAVEESRSLYEDSKTLVPANVTIDYKIYYESEDILSFVITKTKAYNTSMIENKVYNLNLKTGEDITLETLLGYQYQNTIDTQIETQIQERIKNDNNAIYFDDENRFDGIQEMQKFYINKDRKIVIVFDKYEIAPGYMGVQKFVLANELSL